MKEEARPLAAPAKPPIPSIPKEVEEKREEATLLQLVYSSYAFAILNPAVEARPPPVKPATEAAEEAVENLPVVEEKPAPPPAPIEKPAETPEEPVAV